MPILDIQEDVRAELSRLFVLKKGDEKKGNRPGKELPYWRAHASPGASQRAVADFYGIDQVTEQDGKPTELRVFLAGDTMSEVFDPWMKEYVTGNKLKRMCDTKFQRVWLNEATGDYVSDSPKPCEHGQCKCTRRGGLKVFIDGLAHVGYVEVQTGSERDIRTLTARLKKLSQLLNQLNGLRAVYGLNTMTLAAVPCIIRRAPGEVSYNDNGTRKSTGTKYFIELEPDPKWFEMQRAAVQHAASMRLEDMQAHARPVALIESNGHQRRVDPDTGEILDGDVPLSFNDDGLDFDMDDEPEVSFSNPITDEQRDQIDDLGLGIFGDDWGKKALAGFKAAAGRDDITGIGDLTEDEGYAVIARLQAKQAEKAEPVG